MKPGTVFFYHTKLLRASLEVDMNKVAVWRCSRESPCPGSDFVNPKFIVGIKIKQSYMYTNMLCIYPWLKAPVL